MSIWNLFWCGAGYDEIFDELANDASSAKNAGIWDMLGCGSDFDEVLDEIGAQPSGKRELSEDSQRKDGKRAASDDNGRTPLDKTVQAVEPALSHSGCGDAEPLASTLNSSPQYEIEVESSESVLMYPASMPPAVQALIDLDTAESFLLAVTMMIVRDSLHLELLREPLSDLLSRLAREGDWVSIDLLADRLRCFYGPGGPGYVLMPVIMDFIEDHVRT